MSIKNNPYDFLNTPALDAVQKLQKNSALTAVNELQASSAVTATLKTEKSGMFAAAKKIQSTLNAVKSSMGGATAALEEYRRIVAPISESIEAINIAYAPIFKQTRAFDALYIKGIISELQTSASAMSAISGLDLSEIASIIDALPKYDFLSDMVTDDFSVDVAEKLYESGEITQDDINEEITEIVSKKQLSPKAEWNKIKKSKWFIAVRIIIVVVTIICKPIVEYATDKALDSLGITEFWEKLGVYDLIDSIFEDTKESIVSEAEAKATVDTSKTGNISKQKREDLLNKIKEIRTFISAAPQDENTGNLLSYLSDIEKDINGKKYGLIFEEHREEIDEVLDTHTPVLTEDKELFINNGGQMNFLIEGDNLASLKLLEKTHKGKIDLIYIDPPYNTQNEDFIYDDKFVAADDSYRHSKWLSFMKKRLLLCRKLLSRRGFIFISIDDNEAPHLKALCDEIFDEDNYEKTDYIQVRYPDKTLKLDMRYHKEIEQVLVYRKSILAKPYLKPQDYNYDKFVYSIDELSEGKEIELGGKKVVIFQPNEYQIIRHKVGFKDGLKEIWATGTILNGNSSGRFFRDFLNGRKDIDGLCILYKVYGIGDDVYPYRYFTGPKKTNATKGKYYQGVPLDKMTENATKVTPIPNFYDMAGDFGNIRHEGGISFNSGKKPVKLINMYLDYFYERDITVLDFFAGSGSTGHAVLKRNDSDNGTRKFILCTNNENEICRKITYKRLSNVLSEYNGSLKYYKVGYVPIDERMYYEYADELLRHIRELVELENGINFIDNEKIGIVLTEEELEAFVDNTETLAKCSKLYMGHDLLPNEEQERALKENNIEISIIPDYYYRDLQER